MKAALFMVVAALALGAALARCPNGCSGHGNCQRYDKCSCWANWQGNDCSLRTCAFDHAWALDSSDPHYYAECSNKGICDRATGLCDCFDQYEGRACTRSTCPNDCSGHGKCRYIDDYTNAASYAGWDVHKIQVCICDGGYFGPDCSQRYCPMGDDPMTVCNTNLLETQEIDISFDYTQSINGTESGSSAEDFLTDLTTGVDDDDTVNVANKMIVNDEMVISFTDPHGEVWYTQMISGIFPDAADDTSSNIAAAMNTAATAIEEALEALPNKVIPSIDVSATYDTALRKKWVVTFNDDRNIGDQNVLGCHIAGCVTAGCQPMYKQLRMESVEVSASFLDGSNAVTSYGKEVTLTSDSIFNARDSSGNDYAPDWTIYIETYHNGTSDTYGTPPEAHSFYTEVTSGSSTSPTNPFVVRGIIPIEHTHVSIGQGMYLAFANRKPEAGWWRYKITTPSCTVTDNFQTANDNRENAQCSNRGECDHTTGLCACHEGYYGDNCATQTILV